MSIDNVKEWSRSNDDRDGGFTNFKLSVCSGTESSMQFVLNPSITHLRLSCYKRYDKNSTKNKHCLTSDEMLQVGPFIGAGSQKVVKLFQSLMTRLQLAAHQRCKPEH
jgi:hypothetical protein